MKRMWKKKWPSLCISIYRWRAWREEWKFGLYKFRTWERCGSICLLWNVTFYFEASLIEMIRWKKKGMLFLKCALKQSGTLCSGVSAVYKNIGSRCVIEIIITDSLIMSSPYNVRWYARSFLSYQYLHIFVIMIHKNNGSVKGSGDKWGKQNRWGRCERIEEFRWCRHKKKMVWNQCHPKYACFKVGNGSKW